MGSEEPSFRSLPRDERRERILVAAKRVMLEKGVDAASMDDVAARAGTTKPTVYAHFKSKDELFAAVVEYIRGLFLVKLRGPADYADEPAEAVALFCARFLELVSWRDAVGFQRVALAAAGRSPSLTRAVHDTMFAEGCRALAAYLRGRKLARNPERLAELILWATIGGPFIRLLYGVEAPAEEFPDPQRLGTRVEMKRIREAVAVFAAGWNP
ncbi:HTH-type transcriptional repressor BepR [Aquisphaera giovannonii]|uniref:HTH-type transcriptional repressor BepR n=1 Tax=Aquisphaera giovannonii TaxID=406548 RepID=A0A5B9W419_9BACT|nr:TetR/AcrR family transcriptional regulator [Aquisphaera giovannonii]QEH34987.1 HTH-type transcriptional repressor BepR [Aquisphaera giovannonii]